MRVLHLLVPGFASVSGVHRCFDRSFFALFDYAIQREGNNAMASIESKYLSQKTPKEQVQSVALRYTDALYRYIRYTFSLDQMTTEDIVQELFLQLPKKLQKIDTDKPFEPRLYKVTHNFVLDRLRKHTIQTHKEGTRMPEEEFLEKMSSYTGDMLPTKVEQVYKDSLLKVLLSSLSQKNRELIILYYFEQKPYEEIAAILGVKVSGLGTLLRRAKQQLQLKISENPLLEEALIFDLIVDE